ncbi:hypothetical protein [Mesorhizobium sp. Root157]|uniref:hypothetical protein n=1 Tax=Mesorhizobium sp. Root157 TaxID=1736477 RepID=UPI001AECA392|nr:hypothetical protein [Mesorhizobium sp. Root157]
MASASGAPDSNYGWIPTNMQQGGGFLQNLLAPETAMPIAGALMGNQGNTANFANAFGAYGKSAAERLGKNKTLDFLRQNSPDLAAAIDGGMPINDAWRIYADQRFAQQAKPTATLQEYEYAKQQGYGGSFMDYQLDQKKAGANSTNVTVGGGRFGTIPPGFELTDGPNGATMRRIPGGPEDTTKTDERKQGQADVVTRVVTTAASRARDAAKNRAFGGFGQGIVQYNPYSDSAEVARQVDVLKSQAKVENLNAMRQSSPTGGALGSVTEKEAEMLAAKSGALDPSSPNFERDLDDYELTLLQVVHGPEEGARLFQQSRGGAAIGLPTQGGNRTQSGVSWTVEP